MMTKSYADDDLVHESVDVSSLEFRPAAVHHEFRVTSSEENQAVAPGRVTQHAASQ